MPTPGRGADLRLLAAQCHFMLQQYEEANTQLGLAGGNPQDPEAATFVEDLLHEIERLFGRPI